MPFTVSCMCMWLPEIIFNGNLHKSHQWWVYPLQNFRFMVISGERTDAWRASFLPKPPTMLLVQFYSALITVCCIWYNLLFWTLSIGHIIRTCFGSRQCFCLQVLGRTYQASPWEWAQWLRTARSKWPTWHVHCNTWRWKQRWPLKCCFNYKQMPGK